MILRESELINILNDLQMKKFVLSPLLLLFMGLLPFTVVKAQFDDLYYDPETDDSFVFTSTSYETEYDYDAVAYEDEFNRNDRRDRDFDDFYDYQYASRMRRFRNFNNVGFGYYDPCFVDRAYYDPFFMGSNTSIYIGFYNPYRRRNAEWCQVRLLCAIIR